MISDRTPVFEEGVVAARSGKRMLAQMRFEKAVEAAPECVASWIWLAWSADSPDQAHEYISTALEFSPESELLHSLSDVMSYLMDFNVDLLAETSADADETTEASADEESFELSDPVADAEDTQPRAPDSVPGIGPPVTSATPMPVPDRFGQPSGRPDDAETPSNDADAIDVLVVDDSRTIRTLTSRLLAAMGYRVSTAADGLEAVRLLSEKKPALVLLDVALPKMDGYRVCRLIKQHEATRSLPVVMLSARDGLFDKLRGSIAGCDEYLSKPLASAALTRCVAKYVPASAVSAS